MGDAILGDAPAVAAAMLFPRGFRNKATLTPPVHGDWVHAQPLGNLGD